MLELFVETKEYSPEDVLNPFLLLITNDFPKYYYQYFKKMSKPTYITSIIGIQLEVNNDLHSSSILNYIVTKERETLQLHINKPLKINDKSIFITLFNTSEEIIIYTFYNILEKIKKEKLIIGIFVCHPLTTVTEFISNTNNQLINAKNNNCVISVLNLLDY